MLPSFLLTLDSMVNVYLQSSQRRMSDDLIHRWRQGTKSKQSAESKQTADFTKSHKCSYLEAVLVDVLERAGAEAGRDQRHPRLAAAVANLQADPLVSNGLSGYSDIVRMLSL